MSLYIYIQKVSRVCNERKNEMRVNLFEYYIVKNPFITKKSVPIQKTDPKNIH